MKQMKHVLEMSLKESKENSALAVNEDKDLQRAIDARYGNHLNRLFIVNTREGDQNVMLGAMVSPRKQSNGPFIGSSLFNISEKRV